MANLTLTEKRLVEGVWEGLLTPGGGTAPELRVTHLGTVLPDVTVTAAQGGWLVRVPVPAATLSDGVQTYLVTDAAGESLGRFAIAAGAALDEDIRAEVDLLRAELDMLKRAFRRHCVETL